MRLYSKINSADGTVDSTVLYDILTNTNSRRASGNETVDIGKLTDFAADRFDSK